MYSSYALHIESLQETCIPSLKSFEPTVTKLRTGQEMVHKINQRGIIKKRNNVEFLFLCTTLEQLPETCIHVARLKSFWTYGDKVFNL